MSCWIYVLCHVGLTVYAILDLRFMSCWIDGICHVGLTFYVMLD